MIHIKTMLFSLYIDKAEKSFTILVKPGLEQQVFLKKTIPEVRFLV